MNKTTRTTTTTTSAPAPKASKKKAAPAINTTVVETVDTVETDDDKPVAEVEAAAPVAAVVEPKIEKAPKILSQADRIALRVIEKIREDRSAWESTEINGQKAFTGKIGTAIVNIVRNEKPGKKGREVIVLNEIVVTPAEGKVLIIRAGLAARAWYSLTKTLKGPRAKVAPDAETLEAAAAALGL